MAQYKAVVASTSEKLDYETANKTPVIIIDNSKGLYDLLYSKLSNMKYDKAIHKTAKVSTGLGGVAFLLGLGNPITAVGELIFIAILTGGTAITAAAKKKKLKDLSNYKLIDIDAENKEFIIAYKKFNKKKDTYQRKGE